MRPRRPYRTDEWVERGAVYTPEREDETFDVDGPFRGRGPRGWTRSDDDLREEICARMAAHGWLDARRIEVRVDDAEVNLAGTVEDRRQKRLAEDIADSVHGVRDVHNRLRLRRTPDETATERTR